jgi:rRNA maturation endonuclease Nob1
MNPFRKLGRRAERLKQKATGSNDDAGGSEPVYVCTGCEKQYDEEISVCLECDGTEFVSVEP